MRNSAYFWATFGMLAATLAVSSLSDLRGSQDLAAPLTSLPGSIAGWTAGRDVEVDDRTLERLNADSYVSREYFKDGRELGLFVAYYAHQRSGGYMHSPKVCLPSSGWEIERAGWVNVDSPDGRVPINHYTISKSGEKALILYWYESTDRILADEYWTKLFLIHDGLFYGRAAGSIVRIQLPVDPNTEIEAMPFATALMAEVRKVLGK
jgi:EpsI family protein